MTATAHALIGGAIAASVPNPTLGIALSAISHPIADLIPHWDFGWNWKKKSKIALFAQSSLDLLLGIVLVFFLFGRTVDPLYLAAAVFVSEVWDILQMPYLLFNWNFFPFSTFYKVQHGIQGKARLPWGIWTQAATVTGLVLALRTFH